MPTLKTRTNLKSILAATAALLFVAALLAGVAGRAQSKKDFSVSARKYSYRVEGSDRPVIRVQEGDMVRITFSSEDVPHSFTIVQDDHYRIMRRAEPGRPVTFEFLADQAGTFKFQCTLTADSRCKELEGQLIVDAKK